MLPWFTQSLMSSSNFASSKLSLHWNPISVFCTLKIIGHLFIYLWAGFLYSGIHSFIHSQATWASIVLMGIWRWTWGQNPNSQISSCKKTSLQQICTPSQEIHALLVACVGVFILQIISASSLMEIPVLFSGASGKLSVLQGIPWVRKE